MCMLVHMYHISQPSYFNKQTYISTSNKAIQHNTSRHIVAFTSNPRLVSFHSIGQSNTFTYFRFHCIHNIGPYINYRNFHLIRLSFTTYPIHPINCGQTLYSIYLTFLSLNTSYFVHYRDTTVK